MHPATLPRLRGPSLSRMAPALLLAVACLAGCASVDPPGPTATALLHDALFPDAGGALREAEILRPSEGMRGFADQVRRAASGRRDLRDSLVAALGAEGALRLRYEERTRTAAEAFEQRAGNCLSLAVMTAALARELDIPVRFQAVQVSPQYQREPDLVLASGHVNIVLAPHGPAALREGSRHHELTIDFVPAEELRGATVRPLAEHTVLAMFMNNRAAETLAAGQTAQAYAWARAALRTDPGYLPGINTLAVVYLRAGHPAPAEAALRHVLYRAKNDLPALSNLAGLLRQQGHSAEADAIAERLARLQPHPPFHFLDQGRAALREGRIDEARALIARELQLQPFQHEAHFWAAVVDAAQGQWTSAEHHLQQAAQHSPNRPLQARYHAKIEALRALAAH